MTASGPVLEVDVASKGGRIASTVVMGAQRGGVAFSVAYLSVYYCMRFLTYHDLAPLPGSEELVHLKFLIGALSGGLVMGIGKWMRDHGWETVF